MLQSLHSFVQHYRIQEQFEKFDLLLPALLGSIAEHVYIRSPHLEC